MDEFGNMARIDKLKDGLSFLRSYRIRCIIMVQYLAQLTSIYGKEDARAFLNNKVKIAFTLNDIDDAKYFSQSIGNKTVRVTSSASNNGHGTQGGSYSHNTSHQACALMRADEIMQMSKKHEIILIEAQPLIKARKCYWFEEY